MRRTLLPSSSWTGSAPPSLRSTICVYVFSRRTFHKDLDIKIFCKLMGHGSLPGDICCGLLWGLGDRKVVLRSKNRGRVGIFTPKNSVATNSKQDHLVCFPQVSDPAQRRRGPGSGPRDLLHHLRFAVSTSSLDCHPSYCSLI